MATFKEPTCAPTDLELEDLAEDELCEPPPQPGSRPRARGGPALCAQGLHLPPAPKLAWHSDPSPAEGIASSELSGSMVGGRMRLCACRACHEMVPMLSWCVPSLQQRPMPWRPALSWCCPGMKVSFAGVKWEYDVYWGAQHVSLSAMCLTYWPSLHQIGEAPLELPTPAPASPGLGADMRKDVSTLER
jgi:hypothetical protein